MSQIQQSSHWKQATFSQDCERGISRFWRTCAGDLASGGADLEAACRSKCRRLGPVPSLEEGFAL